MTKFCRKERFKLELHVLISYLYFSLGTPGEELSKEEKNLAIMAMKKKDKRLYDRIMHSKKKKRSEVKYFSGLLCVFFFFFFI